MITIKIPSQIAVSGARGGNCGELALDIRVVVRFSIVELIGRKRLDESSNVYTVATGEQDSHIQ